MNDQLFHSSLPSLAIIVAMTRDRVIGTEQGVPWKFPEELQLFKQLTLGSTVIMGRKTFEHIGRPLPERHNIVLSQHRNQLPGVQLCNSFITALGAAWQREKPIFIIGGSEVYRKALSLTNELHISWIKEDYKGDRFFPPLDLSKWVIGAEKGYSDFNYNYYYRCTAE